MLWVMLRRASVSQWRETAQWGAEERCTVGQRQDISDRAVHKGKLGGDNISQQQWVSVLINLWQLSKILMFYNFKCFDNSIFVIVVKCKWIECWALNMKSRHWGHDKRGKQWSSGSGPWLGYLVMLSGCSVVISHVTLGSKSAQRLETG